VARFAASFDGATAIEYGLIAGGVSLTIMVVVFAFGTDLRLVFTTLDSLMETVQTGVQAQQASGG
jgi:pilus assembly protein Flp/PilA